MSRSKFFKSTSLLTGYQVAVYGCGFLKNVVLFRYLSKVDFGIAASFSLTTLMFEIVGKMAIDRLIVQAKDGQAPTFQKSAHLFQFLSGLLGASLTYACARPISALFGVPETCGAFRLLALIPLLRGLVHLDVKRVQRDMRFAPEVAVELVPQVIATSAALPLALWLRDYRAMLVLEVSKTAMVVVGTHLMAERPYRWTWNQEYVKRILAFGWPLLVNGFLLFAIRQGDQFLVGAGYSMEDLANYSVAVSLSMHPGMMMVGVLASVMLPLLAQCQDDILGFRSKYVFSLQILSVASSVFAAAVILVGPRLVVMVYGPRASNSQVFLLWLAAAQALRLLRVAPTMAAMAKADTGNLMITNFFRLSGVALAATVAVWRWNLGLIAVAALVGEALALAASLVCLERQQEGAIRDCLMPLTYLLCILIPLGVSAYWGVPTSNWPILLAALWAALVVMFFAALGLLRVFRSEVLLFKECILQRLVTLKANSWGSSR